MKNSGTIVIDRSIDVVFELATNRMPEWSKIVVEETVFLEKPDGVGTTFKTITEENGKRMEFDGEVIRHQPPNLNAVKLMGKFFDIETEFQFEDVAGSTRVTQFADVNGKGVFKVILFVMGWLMSKAHCEASQRELECLKAFCESQPREQVA